jgi:glycosyltransferase involved in cell wall biosynthesis
MDTSISLRAHGWQSREALGRAPEHSGDACAFGPLRARRYAARRVRTSRRMLTTRPPPVGLGEPPPVLVFAGLDWWYHNRAHADFQLATRLARERRVLLINSIGPRLPRPGRTSGTAERVLRKLKSFARGVRQPLPDTPDFHVYSPVTVPAYGSPLGRRVNALLVRWQVQAVSWWLGVSRPVVLMTPPTAWPVVRALHALRIVVNRSDKHSAWAEVDQNYVRSLERQMLSHADAVLYVAHSLMEEDAEVVGDRAVFLDHGVDSTWFESSSRPPAFLERVPRPRVGYVGTLRDHTVDLGLLHRVATELTDVSLVIVGPVFMETAGLEQMPNVHFVGPQPYEHIPRWCAGLDVALMPWLDNEWIRACNPIKMKEYLALGLPTVTTDFPETHRYAHVIDIARSPDEFVALVRAALSRPRDAGAAARRAAVAGDTWDARVAELQKVILEPAGTPSGAAG